MFSSGASVCETAVLSPSIGPGVGRVTTAATPVFSLDRQTALTLWVTFCHQWGCQGAWTERGHQPKVCLSSCLCKRWKSLERPVGAATLVLTPLVPPGGVEVKCSGWSWYVDWIAGEGA